MFLSLLYMAKATPEYMMIANNTLILSGLGKKFAGTDSNSIFDSRFTHYSRISSVIQDGDRVLATTFPLMNG